MIEYLVIVLLWYYVGYITIQHVNCKYSLQDHWKQYNRVEKAYYVSIMPVLYIVMGTYSAFEK